MNYLILLTVAGSLLFLGYLCWESVCGKSLTQGMKYKALVTVLFVYAVPWIWLRQVYTRIIVLFLQGLRSADEAGPVKLADIKAQTQAYRTQDYQMCLWILGAWMLGTLIFLAAKLYIYFHKKQELQSSARECRNELPEENTIRLKGEFHCRRKPELYQVPGSITLTLGAIKPVIFLQEDYTNAELDLVLRHEMTHIARGDLMIKLLLELVCCLHWFNPLIYILRSRFEFICETSCDERVLAGCTKEERKAYAKLIVRSSVESKEKIVLGSAFGNGGRKVQKRVNLILKTREMKKWGKIITAGCFALMLFANSLTALAYPRVNHVEDVTVEAAEKAVNGNSFWGYNQYEEVEIAYDEFDFLILYDEQFIDEAGNIYPAESVNPQIICFKHNIVSGYFSIHYKNEDGSCTIDVYESTKCTKCNNIWVGRLEHSTTFTTCPH